MNSKASLGLSSHIVVNDFEPHRVGRMSLPVGRLHRNLLVEQLPALLEDEMAALRFASLSRTQSGYEHALRVRQQWIGQVFLYSNAHVRRSIPKSKERKGKWANLGLPFSLSSRLVRAQTVHVEARRREIGVYIAESTSLLRATSCGTFAKHVKSCFYRIPKWLTYGYRPWARGISQRLSRRSAWPRPRLRPSRS